MICILWCNFDGNTFFYSDLKQARARLLELLPDPHHDVPKVEAALKLYLAVLRGFLEPPNGQGNKSGEDGGSSGGTRASKLRHAVRFRWSQSMLGTTTPEAQNDAAFEVGYVCGYMYNKPVLMACGRIININLHNHSRSQIC